MPTATYDLIASNVLGSSAASVTFSSIPATYRDLIVVVEASSSGASNTNGRLTFNSDTGNNYNWVLMIGDGSSATSASSSNTSNIIILESATSTRRVLGIAQIQDYSATDKHKSTLGRYGNAATATTAAAGRWANTAAITSVTIEAFSGTGLQWASGSSFYLYGIVS